MSAQQWFPTLEEYDPGISKETWLKILDDRNITYESNLHILACFYNFGGEATCSQLAQKYGNTSGFYNSPSISFAKRIIDNKFCPKPELNDEKSKRWPVLFLGHDADKDTPGTFVWKLRDELKEACKEYNIEKWLNIAPFDMEEFKKALKAYKKEFNIHIGEEIYKWKAIKQFQAFSIFYRDKRQFLIFCKMNYKDISLLSTVSKILYAQKDFLLRPSVKSCTPKNIFLCAHP